jgi:ketosteroid isomerase-like protein
VSRKNVEFVARLYELYGRGEIDELLAGVDPDVEVDLSDRLPDQGILRGHDGYRSFLEKGFEIWADFRVEVEELLDAGDAVVVLTRSVAVGEGSGAQVEERIAHVVWLRDETAYRLKVFTSREQALQAAGLPVLRAD